MDGRISRTRQEPKIQRLTEDFTALKDVGEKWFNPPHDGIVHNPLGGAAYVYEKEFAKPRLRALGLIPVSARFSAMSRDDESRPAISHIKSDISRTQDPTSCTLYIHIGAQPNNSPHAGTIITFALAFLVGRLFREEYGKLRARALASSLRGTDPALWVDDLRVVVQLDLVDTAPDKEKTTELDGVTYQFSHRETGTMNKFLKDYERLLSELYVFVGGSVKYNVTYQEQLMRMPATRDAVRTLIRDRDRLAGELHPQREVLAIRSACPACGMADKHGIKNIYTVSAESTLITFNCPTHGAHTLRLEDPDELARLELNTPLRNLARTLVYMADTAESRVPGQAVPTRLHMRVTGSDYAGPYQEPLLFDQLSELKKVAEPAIRDVIGRPVIVYSPLITDWSGAKLSKTLYVVDGAYEYLAAEGRDRLLAYEKMSEMDRRVLFRVVEGWVREPAKVHRPYSIEYLHLMFKKAARLEEGLSPGDSVS